MINLEDFICIAVKVLTSMRKDCVHAVPIVIRESTCSVVIGYSTCAAGLSGCCNHVSGTYIVWMITYTKVYKKMTYH